MSDRPRIDDVRRVGGGPISTSALLFDLASRHLFTASASAVCVHSIETGSTLRRLEGHAGTVTSVKLNPTNRLQIYSGSLDKTIKLWDYKDAVLLRTFEVHAPVAGLLFLETAPGVLFWWTHLVGKKKGKARLGALHRLVVSETAAALVDDDDDDSDSGTAADAPATSSSDGGKAGPVVGEPVEAVFEGKEGRNWLAHPTGRYMVGYGDRDWGIYWPDSGKSKSRHVGKSVTCFACHPTDDCVAIGDDKGKITMLHSITSDKLVQSTYHWHSHGVSSVVFNSDGTYMMSGGEEAVLVIWQLETGNKRFLPRLGSPIIGLGISIRDTHYATVHEDNSVQVIDALSLKIIGQIRGLRRDNTKTGRPDGRCGLLVEPTTGHVVLNGSLGALQFFNLDRDSVVKEQQVVDRLYVSRTEDEEMFTTTIEKVSFSRDGEWLATIEYRNDGETECDVRLKFWRVSGNKYTLNTSADSAHKERITSLSAHPTEKLFVTTGGDSRFKAWGLQETGGVHNQETWRCLYVRSYLELPCTSSSFSADSSLLAVGTGHFVTLWDPLTCDLVQAIATVRAEPVRGVSFCSKSDLVSFGESHLTVWNLLNCSVRWRVQLAVDLFCVDLAQTRFAVVPRKPVLAEGKTPSTRQTILEFVAAKPKPIRQRTVKAYNAACDMAYLAPVDAGSKPTLLLFDEDRTFKAFTDGRESAAESGIKRILAPLASDVDGLARQGYESLFGGQMAPDADDSGEGRSLDAFRGGKDPSQMLFDVPTHVVPPMDTVAGSFMNLLLRKRKRTDADAAAAEATPAEDAGDDTIMSVDPPVVVPYGAMTRPVDALPGTVAGGSDLGFLVDFFKRGKTPEMLRNANSAPSEKKQSTKLKKRSKKGSKKGMPDVEPVASTGLHPLSKRKKLKMSRKRSDGSNSAAS